MINRKQAVTTPACQLSELATAKLKQVAGRRTGNQAVWPCSRMRWGDLPGFAGACCMSVGVWQATAPSDACATSEWHAAACCMSTGCPLLT